jgi:hypothetical protein
MDDSPLSRLRESARRLGARAASELLDDERRAETVGSVLRRLQELRGLVDERGGRVLTALGLATQTDLERVQRKIGRLRKRMEAILDRLD